ncbi:alpha/beta fold hydrolase [Leeia sp. TBRC 13508]|uniref:Alpha/beta fold hydrolase n=1 Tax=Leeia speluncae TaxID=2884804 RepID=A0ABS8D993_9NEIS|nr:alpha/beta fold hydrolase [Leeia speluncae]MCB6184792.1 alpha/beta fold hydrolase [Leeia speluncae]
MKVDTFNLMIDGPVGQLETILMTSPLQAVKGIALVAHPNPTQGGTNTNKVVQTIAKAFARKGYAVYCPNLRGVGNSAGEFDAGIGETDDMAAVLAYARQSYGNLPLILSGFSFGTFVQASLGARLTAAGETFGMLLAGPAVKKFDVPSVPAETLIVHGEEDEVIPLQHVLDWARPQKLPVVVLPGVSHFFHGHLGQLTDWVNLKWPS